MKRMLYAGSFDPITNGHLDLIERASKLCDELVVGVIENKSKIPTYTGAERMEMIRQVTAHLKNTTVDCFDGLLASYVMSHNIQAVLRGLRATMDFEYEIQMAHMNARLYNKNVETIFLMTSPDYSFISSSMMKEVFSLGGNISGLVPDAVLTCMEQKRLNHDGREGQ